MSDPFNIPGHHTAIERYHSDPQFHAVVAVMLQMLRADMGTTADLREAAVLASIQYEAEVTRPRYMISADMP